MKIKISSQLDIGKRRDNNEDELVYCPDLGRSEWRQGNMESYVQLADYGALAVVADGMGGANAGEVASSIAIQSVKELFTPERVAAAVDGGDDTIKSLMDEAIKLADRTIQQRIASDSETQGMGTTIVLCWILNDKAHIGWCGDSRCYAYHPLRGLKPLTHDHSLVQELVDKGEITLEEAFSHPDGNIITRGIGDFGCDVQPEFCIHSVGKGETLLLCSDGLCGYCRDGDMEACMDRNYTDVVKCSEELLQLTLDAGGYDNISIVNVSMIDDSQEVPASLSFIQSMVRRFKRMI